MNADLCTADFARNSCHYLFDNTRWRCSKVGFFLQIHKIFALVGNMEKMI